MDTDEIKKKIVPILLKYNVTAASIFGSVARGEANAKSDVDILVELPDDKTMFDLIDLEQNLESALNKKVDVVTYRSLHPLLRNQILREQVSML